MIEKFNFMTPGREEDEAETKLYTKKDFEATKKDGVSEIIVRGLGGIENIEDLECCATRLRIKVKNPEQVDDNILKQSGCAGVIKKGSGVQIIFGPRVTVIKAELEEYIEANK